MSANAIKGFAMGPSELDAAMRYLRKSLAAGLTNITKEPPFRRYTKKNGLSMTPEAIARRAKRAEWVAAGLTTLGKPRMRKPNHYADV